MQALDWSWVFWLAAGAYAGGTALGLFIVGRTARAR